MKLSTGNEQANWLPQLSQNQERSKGFAITWLKNKQQALANVDIKYLVQKASTIQSMTRVAPRGFVKSLIDLAVTDFANSLNNKYNLSDFQVKQMVEHISEAYKYESIEDIMYVFNQAKSGAFGVVYNFDLSVFANWMQQHLDVKSMQREAINKSGQPSNKPKLSYDEWLKTQPQWFQDLSPEKQKEVIDKYRRQWYEEGIRYQQKQAEIRKQYKKGMSPKNVAEYEQYKKQWIKDFWEQEQQKNDKVKASNSEHGGAGDSQVSTED